MKKTYRSAIDLWLASILVGVPLAMVTFGAYSLTRSVMAGVLMIAFGAVTGALIAAFTIPCLYTLTDENLKIQCGVLEDDVPLARIRKVEKSSSALSAPALSLRRVRLSLDDGQRLISPKDRDGFIADLTARLRQHATGPGG